jgi:hypothetical protein
MCLPHGALFTGRGLSRLPHNGASLGSPPEIKGAAWAFAPSISRSRLHQRSLPGLCAVAGSWLHPVARIQRQARARSSTSVLVGALAVEKRLFLNVPRERRVGALFGKKFCDINERLNPF